jgi:hypothetical protein
MLVVGGVQSRDPSILALKYEETDDVGSHPS